MHLLFLQKNLHSHFLAKDVKTKSYEVWVLILYISSLLFTLGYTDFENQKQENINPNQINQS